ncbi:MAG: ferredoxin family protein [Dehalococcoidia bacterium]
MNNDEVINLSNADERESFFNSPDAFINESDLLIVGLPVYFDKIPKFFSKSFAEVNGNGKLAIAIVVYGNKGAGIGLKQLVTMLDKNDFKVVGVASFIGEHSLSSEFPIALGRPDDNDMTLARGFGKAIHDSLGTLNEVHAEDVPGQRDVLLRITPEIPPKPKTDLEKCDHCGICVQFCPMGIIDWETKIYKNKSAENLCLGCMSCVKNCPRGAKSVDLSPVLKYLTGKLFLNEAMKYRKEPYTYIKQS